MTPIKKIAVTGIMMLGAASVMTAKIHFPIPLISDRSLAASIARLVLYLQTQKAAIEEIPVDFDGTALPPPTKSKHSANENPQLTS